MSRFSKKLAVPVSDRLPWFQGAAGIHCSGGIRYFQEL